MTTRREVGEVRVGVGFDGCPYRTFGLSQSRECRPEDVVVLPTDDLVGLEHGAIVGVGTGGIDLGVDRSRRRQGPGDRT